MKRVWVYAAMILLLGGCTFKEVEVAYVGLQNECAAPRYTIYVKQAYDHENKLRVSKSAVLDQLGLQLARQGCYKLVRQAPADAELGESAYMANVHVGSEVEQKRDEGWFSDKIKEYVRVRVTLYLSGTGSKAGERLEISGRSQIENDTRSVFGLGEGHDKEKIMAMAIEQAVSSTVLKLLEQQPLK